MKDAMNYLLWLIIIAIGVWLGLTLYKFIRL